MYVEHGVAFAHFVTVAYKNSGAEWVGGPNGEACVERKRPTPVHASRKSDACSVPTRSSSVVALPLSPPLLRGGGGARDGLSGVVRNYPTCTRFWDVDVVYIPIIRVVVMTRAS